MQFCPRCGAILIQKRKNFGCARCTYTTNEKIKIETRETVSEKKPIAVIKEHEGEVLPIVEESCQKCKNKQAYFWTIQTRSSDEAETKFFKCTKCGHTWRVYR